MCTGLLVSFAVIMMVALPLAAQTPIGPSPPAPPQPSGPTGPVPRLVTLPLIDQRTEVLLQVQQLTLCAHSELRTKALQVSRQTRSDGSIVTYAEADPDGDTLIARSRARALLLVTKRSFDAAHTLTRVIFHGSLAHFAEQRHVRTLTGDWTATPDCEGAAFAPAKQAAFLNQLDLRGVKALLGLLPRQAVRFLNGTEDDSLYWEVTATAATGEALGFEPYASRLVRFAKGGVQ
jgi:hypothetical protein